MPYSLSSPNSWSQILMSVGHPGTYASTEWDTEVLVSALVSAYSLEGSRFLCSNTIETQV